MKQYVYADNAATTKMDKVAYEAMTPYLLEEYGNASQPYAFSRTPETSFVSFVISFFITSGEIIPVSSGFR